jgi:hypothetical protein
MAFSATSRGFGYGYEAVRIRVKDGPATGSNLHPIYNIYWMQTYIYYIWTGSMKNCGFVT